MSFLVLALGPKMSRVAFVSISSSLCLNPRHTVLHGWPPTSPSKPSQNQIATKTQKPTKSQIKSHPLKLKHKTHKTTKITKWKHWKWRSPLNHKSTLLLNLHGRSFSSSSTPTMHHCQNLAKIKSQQKPKSPPNHKSNHTHRNQSTKPTKQPKSQNENTESEPTVKKNIYWFCYYILKEESSCWPNFRSKLI